MLSPDSGLNESICLQDGRRVRLELIGGQDRHDLLSGFDGLSSHSRYLRFFTSMPTLPAFIADGLLNTDAAYHVAIGARLVDASGATQAPIVGVARYFRTPDNPTVAEPAVAVVDELQGLGLGKGLLRELSRHARANGVDHFRAHVLADNARVCAMLQAAHGKIVEQDGAVLVYDVDIQRPARPQRRGVMKRILGVMLRSERSRVT